MENFITIIRIIAIIISICAALIPSILTLLKAIKVRREAAALASEAKSETERAQAEAQLASANLLLEETAKKLIVEAEATYKMFDDLMRQRGQSAGALKKDTVLAKLRTVAIENGISIDVNEWSARIDQLVQFTKQVNSK